MIIMDLAVIAGNIFGWGKAVFDSFTVTFGDLTINGMRNNALLIRENGMKKDFYRFDLTSSDLFSSPYFYLKQNDIIYIEPNEAKQNSSKIDSRKQFNISVASTITSVVATIASLCIALFIK